MTCRPYRIEGRMGFICSRGKPAIQRCAFCDRVATLLCDYPVLDKTCDKALCRAHAVHSGKNVDHCANHPGIGG